MTGKEKCELLKTIRKNIADMNGIEYKPEPCTHEGDCPGFCPRCDQEAAYLMRELKKKEAAGSPIRIDTESIDDFETLVSEPLENDDDVIEMGDIVTPGIMPPPDDEMLMGKMVCPEPPEIPTLQGDVVMTDEGDTLEDDEEEVDHEQFLEENRPQIKAMCGDCIRYNTICSTEKGVRCSCLSEHFFLDQLEKMHCTLKKTTE